MQTKEPNGLARIQRSHQSRRRLILRGGVGSASKTRTVTARGSHGSREVPLPGVTAANRGDNREVTSVAADEAGELGRHGIRPGVRERVFGRQENLAGKFSGVVEREGIREASRVAENSRGLSRE